ncbi:MAG TPA: ISL3 family transposase [Acidimicrobiales bacterium]|nr:ISL3 family transposase [Acidimicrobiales bacterium]
MTNGNTGATALLGMDGFEVLAMTEEAGEVFISVQTRPAPVGCGACGTRAVGHGRTRIQIRDLPAGGRPVRLVWAKRRWSCPEAACETKTFSEDSALVEDCLTTRAAKDICRRVGEQGSSVASVAREAGVGWSTAMAAVTRHGTPLVEDPARLGRVRALGVDEHKMLAASRTRNTFYATSFVDVRSGALLDVVRGRNADDVAYWLSGASPAWRQNIEAVAIDPHRGYLRGILAQLPNTAVTVDCFHGVKLANTAIDDVRRRVQQGLLGHRGHRDDPLYRTRRLMTRGWERLTDRQRDKLLLGLAQGDPDGEVSATIVGKELVREMYAAKSYPGARRALVRFYEHVAGAEVPELTRLARTISAWESEVLNYHVTHISNGPTEARNLVTEKIRRIGHGFRNFANYRLRLLLHSGVQWNTPVTARIRGRHPQLAA